MRAGLIDWESGSIVFSERLEKARGLWVAEFYEGDPEYNDCGRRLNPVVWRSRKRNLITTVGKGLVLDRLFNIGGPAVQVSGIAVGTSSTAAAVGDTAITGPVYKAFTTGAVRASLTVTATTSYTTAEANIAIAEAGSLTASAGTLFNRVAPFLSFTKTSSFSLDLTLSLTQS